jgi:hypothetical protein
MKKVTRAEFLQELRARINKWYMPSATGEVQYNSKPSYLRHQHPFIEDGCWPNASASHDQSGFLAFERFGTTPEALIVDGQYVIPPKDIYLWLDLYPVYILVNLQNVDIRVAVSEEGYRLNYLKWDDDAQEIALDRFKLQNAFECYV